MTDEDDPTNGKRSDEDEPTNSASDEDGLTSGVSDEDGLTSGVSDEDGLTSGASDGHKPTSGGTTDVNDRLVRVTQVVGVQFALVTASIHVWWGAPRALVYARAGTLADPRPYLFLLSAAAIFAGVVALAAGYAPRRLYALGTLVMGVYTVSYVWWHLGGHGGAIPGVAGYGHPQLSNLDTLFSSDHLFRPLDALSMVSQVVAAGCFTALWWQATPSRETRTPTPTEEP